MLNPFMNPEAMWSKALHIKSEFAGSIPAGSAHLFLHVLSPVLGLTRYTLAHRLIALVF